jgi:DNA-binding NarL/FixJ family response regulator
LTPQKDIGVTGNGAAVSVDDRQVATRVVVAEDDVLLREGLASLLDRSGFEVVGQTGDSRDLLGLVRDKSPALVVTDIRMPPTHTTEGLDVARLIRQQFPDTAILVLSAHVDVEHAMELLASGHSIGYLLKSRVTDVADFIDTLQRISDGASVVDPALVQELVTARRRDDPLAALSERVHQPLQRPARRRPTRNTPRRNRSTARRRPTGPAASPDAQPIPALDAHDVFTGVMQRRRTPTTRSERITATTAAKGRQTF